jgi:hypothetical protein
MNDTVWASALQEGLRWNGMNPRSLERAGRIGGFCARHLFALGVAMLAACAAWTVTYFALLLWAVLTGGGLGGPLAYPAGLLFALVAMAAAGLVLLLPATALAEWVARRRGFPVLAQIPVSVGILALLCLAVVGLVSAGGFQPTLRGASIGFGTLFLALLLPLGLYWWTAQSIPLLASLLARTFPRSGFGSAVNGYGCEPPPQAWNET